MNLEDILNNKEAQKEFREGRKKVKKVSQEEHTGYVRKTLQNSYDSWKNSLYQENEKQSYEKAVSAIKGKGYTKEDVSDFCSDGEFIGNSYKIGIFLSALINSVLQEDDRVTIAKNESEIDNLGIYLERGIVTVEATIGDNFGMEMSGGTLIAKTPSYSHCGNKMKGGNLILEQGFKDKLEYGGFFGGGLNEIEGGSVLVKNFKTKSEIGFGCGFCHEQKGGTIEIFGDIPRNITHMGFQQEYGDLIIHGDVYSEFIGCQKTGGKLQINGSVIGYTGHGMEGGDIIITKDAKQLEHYSTALGFRLLDGKITLEGDCYQDVAHESSGGKIIIFGNVYNNIGTGDTEGTYIKVHKNVFGNIANSSPYLTCIVEGNVEGDVGGGFGGNNYDKGNGYIKVDGNVSGTVGNWLNRHVIEVNGSIGKLGEMISGGGKVIQNGRDVTSSLPLFYRVVTKIFPSLGAD